MDRYYYYNSVNNFLEENSDAIFGKLTKNDQFSAGDEQKNTWGTEIDILKKELIDFKEGDVLFEYTIPRIGKRIDNILIYNGIVFLLEFKVGSEDYPRHAKDQVIDYALDLNSFHEESHDKLLVPILICTNAIDIQNEIKELKENILDVICCNENNISKNILEVCKKYKKQKFNAIKWINSVYKPTPTIIEAARALYLGHNVKDISRNDASATNLNITTEAINEIIDYSKSNNRKSICFITGVPGAGKTLAGLNIAIERQKCDENEHAVFLSGNGPLVKVLQKALANDDTKRNKIKIGDALRKAKGFIQNIHIFRDDALSISEAPIEKVVVFDEAQRAWDVEKLNKFMKKKKNKENFNMSEPDFLISILDRHKDWATIVCLIGGGQEINEGESEGIAGWLKSIRDNYPEWDVYLSSQITDDEYSKGVDFSVMTEGLEFTKKDELHLSISLRSFRSENVSKFVKAVLDLDKDEAKELYKQINEDYPISITRDLEKAKKWVKEKAKGSERYGLTASSGGKRLRVYGIWVENKIKPENWFLNDKDSVSSSYSLEETATEFDVQGLELDWTIVCWDANLRIENDKLIYKNLSGSNWNDIHKKNSQIYLKNAYRVLLTRARQGFIIFVPEGNNDDATIQSKFYDGIYNYLKEIGIYEV